MSPYDDDNGHPVIKGHLLQEDKEDNTTSSSSSSTSSSPSPEFSFTVALRPRNSSSDILLSPNGKTKSLSPFAVDLSPADDIFFHGHLLPLQILSHLPVSPRSSTTSPDKFNLPIKERFDGSKPQAGDKNRSCSIGDNVLDKSHGIVTRNNGTDTRFSFTLSSLFKWKKGSESNSGENEKKGSPKKRHRFELIRVLRRCVRMVKQAAHFPGRNEKATTERESYRSFSGNLSLRQNINDLRDNRGKYSAPLSARTSPTNSGLLVPTKRLSSSASDRSVEELQAAVEAAIAHCKKSFAIEGKVQ